MIRKPAVSIFKFFASLQLAIFLLLSLGIVFGIGTFVESSYGTEAAKLMVYRSPWMSLLLIFLALNVAAAALDRLPWKQKHVGFVVTHVGIILILAGALITRAYGMEGQLAIAEGKTESRMITNQPMLQIFSKNSTPLAIFQVRPHAFAWKGRESLLPLGVASDSVPQARLVSYYPKSSRREKVQESSAGPAALQVNLQSSFMKQNHWLVLDDPNRSEILLGPAELRFTRQPIEPPKNSSRNSSETGLLEFQFENSNIKIPIPEKTPKKIRLQGTPYQITVLRVLKDAVVDRGQLVGQSEKWNNPACELTLEGNGIKEKHTVFSKFPDFPTLHGMKPSAAGVKIFFHRPEESGSGAKNELRFVWQEKGLPIYQIRKGAEVSQGTVQLNQDYSTGWMDFKFRVGQYYPRAEVKSMYKEEPVNSQADEHLSSLEIELEKGGERKSLWLGQGDRETMSLGGGDFQIVYGLRTVPLGFRLELRNFRVENYPGTNRPAAFESDVTLKDDFTGTVRDVTIRMNHPLKYRGFKVFQSGYQVLPGQPQTSIFTVAKDPGIPVKYAGAVILIGGILTMFYSRRFSCHAEDKKEKVVA